MSAAASATHPKMTRTESEIPPGWSYNPSVWPERLPIVALAASGFAIATYLALYQYRVIGSVWEPFFGKGSVRVLNSWISRALPVSDAAIGASVYLLEVFAGLIGGEDRWRAKPWAVLLLGLIVAMLGVVSLLLMILQPLLFGSWCTLCLAAALTSIVMVGLALDEVLATLQHLVRVSQEGGSLPKAIWGKGL